MTRTGYTLRTALVLGVMVLLSACAQAQTVQWDKLRGSISTANAGYAGKLSHY